MGDRANVFVRERPADDQGVYLYTHWGGYELPDVVHAALSKRWRWDDSSYLARIVFCAMVAGEEAEETGYGISTHPPDNERPIIVLDVDLQQIALDGIGDTPELGRWEFAEFVQNPEPMRSAFRS